MTMIKRNRLRSARPKAIFGIDGAINAAATIAAAGIQAAATNASAKQQVDAIRDNANRQAEALRLQNENANRNQKEMIEFTRQQNELERQLMKDIQMRGQFQAGNQNDIAMREAAKMQLKCGGSIRRKLKYAGVYDASLLQGINSNLPFTVTDGGGVIPLYSTPEGYDLYEIVGNDHEHRHQARSGASYKTGVGIKFAGGQTIEGEGNQNTNQGEYMLVTPNDAKFISKHTIRGINPVELVNAGMHPLQAFNIQERIKDAYNIPDSGRYAKIGRSLKRCGGRNKASDGGWYSSLNDTQKGNLWGAGFNALGNIGGALISNIGNNRASRILNQGYDDSASILADAYSRLRGVDMNLIDRNMYRSAHAMAALQAPIVNSGAERAAAERSLQRNLSRINRNTLSSAAALNRSGRAETDYNDILSQINSNDEKIRQAMIQENMARITQTANANADRDTQAMREYARDYLGLLQYNNETANEAITGAAQAKADAALNKASNIAGTKQANASSWAGAISSSLNSFGNTLATNAKMAHELEMGRYGWSAENNLNWTIRNNDLNEARMLYKRYKGAGGQYDIWATQLENAFGINKLKY